jgi:hypothetical protein
MMLIMGMDEGMKDAAELAKGALDQARLVAMLAMEESKKFLASDEGKKLRHYAATGLMLAAPAVASIPIVRRTKLGKMLELAGGATMIATIADKIRDWEPASQSTP